MEKLPGRPLSEVRKTLDATALSCIKAQLTDYLKQLKQLDGDGSRGFVTRG
jgi:hypothetical protein